MNFIGLDIHKKTISYCVKDISGKVCRRATGVTMNLNPPVHGYLNQTRLHRSDFTLGAETKPLDLTPKSWPITIVQLTMPA